VQQHALLSLQSGSSRPASWVWQLQSGSGRPAIWVCHSPGQAVSQGYSPSIAANLEVDLCNAPQLKMWHNRDRLPLENSLKISNRRSAVHAAPCRPCHAQKWEATAGTKTQHPPSSMQPPPPPHCSLSHSRPTAVILFRRLSLPLPVDKFCHKWRTDTP
jgi:hypothetical protein